MRGRYGLETLNQWHVDHITVNVNVLTLMTSENECCPATHIQRMLPSHTYTTNAAQPHIYNECCPATYIQRMLFSHTHTTNAAQPHIYNECCPATHTQRMLLSHTHTTNAAQPHTCNECCPHTAHATNAAQPCVGVRQGNRLHSNRLRESSTRRQWPRSYACRHLPVYPGRFRRLKTRAPAATRSLRPRGTHVVTAAC